MEVVIAGDLALRVVVLERAGVSGVLGLRSWSWGGLVTLGSLVCCAFYQLEQVVASKVLDFNSSFFKRLFKNVCLLIKTPCF